MHDGPEPAVPATAGRQTRARLRDQILDHDPAVQDPLAVAALIESFGWTDRRVAAEFGYPSVFELAEALFDDVHHHIRGASLAPQARWSTRAVLRRVLWDFGHGLTFTLPMMVAVFSMMTLHISLAAYQYFQVQQATALAMATFLSFVATGGFSQAIATVYYLLIDTQGPVEVQVNVLRVIGWGLGSTLMLGALVWILDSLFPLMPLSLMSLMVLYLVLLSGLWLAYAGLYVLRREYVLALITGIGGGLTWWLHHVGWSVVEAQSLALVAGAVVSLGVSAMVFRRARKITDREGRSVVRPRPSQLAYATRQYFLYGVLYFVFVFADRLVAWTTNTVYLPFNVWFRGQYELGMDWSLAALFIPLSISEAVISYYLRWVDAAQHEVSFGSADRLGRDSRRLYFRLFILFGVVSAVGVVVAQLTVRWIAPWRGVADIIPVHGVEPFVFVWSSFAYVLLALSLLNILLMFSLSYPEPALRSLIRAIAVDVGVGVLATRLLGGYQYAVLGLLAGAAYLMGSTTWDVLRLFRRVDYLLYRLT